MARIPEESAVEVATAASADPPAERRSFGDIMGAIFLPMLPALIGAGILQGITSILVSFGLLAEGSAFHWVLSTVSSGIFYFLPFLLAGSTARAFDTSPYLAIGVVAFFLAPGMVEVMEGSGELSLFGIPVVRTTYTSSVIPIILMIWGMSFVHRLSVKLTPDLLKTVLVPPVTIAVTCIVGLLVLGPLGALLTRLISSGIGLLDLHAGWMIPMVVGAFGALMVSVGLSFGLFPIALESLLARGYDGVYGPGMLASNMALAGMALAVALRAADRGYRAFSLTASATASWSGPARTLRQRPGAATAHPGGHGGGRRGGTGGGPHRLPGFCTDARRSHRDPRVRGRCRLGQPPARHIRHGRCARRLLRCCMAPRLRAARLRSGRADHRQ